LAFTFKGGLHPEENKITAKVPIEIMPQPTSVAIAMSQHIGVPSVPTVKKGDRVLKGQCIGKNDAGLSCPVHASVSGTVTGIEDRVNFMGQKTQYVIIENDFTDELDPSIAPFPKSLEEATCEDIVECVKNAGIAGMGGATFPTHFKIAGAKDRVDKLIINCCECEPYITANHRLMLEAADELIGGAKIVMHALGLTACDIAIEDNKKDAIEHVESRIPAGLPIRVCTMKTKYPQGDERQIIYALDKIEIPTGKLPADVGRIVINAETSAAIYRAFTTGMPLIERIITVTGAVAEPKNLRIPLGTSVAEIAAYCGGYTGEIEKIISGGPMMGQALWNEETAVAKGTSSLIFMLKEEKKHTPEACIHCGKCVASCPMHLMPCYLALFSKNSDVDSLKEFDVMSCVECGCCTYQCPGNVPIVQYIRAAKGMVKKSM
jgi:electron transport complex protein RnfC